MSRFINIAFPFSDSANGFFLKMNQDSAGAIKSDLMHLILTKRGERYYNGDFGTNLLAYIFEPNDQISLDQVKSEIITQVSKYMPKLKVTDITISQSESNDHVAIVTINYTITDDVFTQNDQVVITI